MKYINEKIIKAIGIDWTANIANIKAATSLLKKSEYKQPLKTYLRFNDIKNRIIAMPAYIGGEMDAVGIKWIASFPDNVNNGIKRAHAVIVLNDSNTGIPVCIINSAYISAIRTAAVSGFFLTQYFENNISASTQKNCGIIGFGPIGQIHLDMLVEHFHNHIGDIFIYDVEGIDIKVIDKHSDKINITVLDSWEQVFDRSEILITATVSPYRYINKKPKPGGVYLNVSLRDFEVSFLEEVDVIVVDNWLEVCRENTDIEAANKALGLCQENILDITDILDTQTIQGANLSLMFNPMGMGIYDIAIANHYYNLSKESNIAIILED